MSEWQPVSKRLRSFGWTCVLLLACGCAPSLKNNPPRDAKKEVPDDYGTQPGAAQAGSRTNKRSSVPSWSTFFTDPDLKALIQAALDDNQELKIRQQEIIIAQNEVKARKGEYTPRLNAEAGAGVEKVGKYTSHGASDEAHGLPENLGNFRFGLAASWEIDIWKKLRNASKAAALRYLATIEGRNFLTTQLVAEIAKSYYELLALDNQLDVLKRNIAIQKDALEIVKVEKIAARVTQLAVQRFAAEVLKNRSRQFALEQQRIQTENRINFLLGRFPQHVKRDPEKFKQPLPKKVRAGVPAQLLDYRPDVRQAELDLEASKLDAKVARAYFYPALSIEAGVGYESFNVKHLVTTPQSLVYNLAGNLTAPLLNRTAIKAQYRSANARQLQAVYNYERTILQAFTEVRNQLATIENLQKSYELQAAQVEQLVDSIEVSHVLFQSARADYMEVLFTRRDSLDAEMELIDTKLAQMNALVNMYQALGGGFR